MKRFAARFVKNPFYYPMSKLPFWLVRVVGKRPAMTWRNVPRIDDGTIDTVRLVKVVRSRGRWHDCTFVAKGYGS